MRKIKVSPHSPPTPGTAYKRHRWPTLPTWHTSATAVWTILTLGLNLGSGSIQDWIGLSHPGLGLPSGTYHIKGGGIDQNIFYSSGYLQFTLPATNGSLVTISSTSTTVFQLYLPMIIR